MRFLVDEGVPTTACDVLREFGLEGLHVRALGLGGAEDERIAAHAAAAGLAILTLDFDFADVRVYSPEKYGGIAVLSPPANARLSVILSLVRVLASDEELIRVLPGRLAIVEFGRIRLRPPI